jgi:sugar phosphate isomerase/epimerase
MQLGFVSAILADLSLEEVLAFASDEGFACVELMCWPPGKADRRYAGVTHLDVTNFTPETAAHVRDLVRIHGVDISGLGYYPNPLDPDMAQRQKVGDHLKKVIRAAPQVGVKVVNTFIGRDQAKSVAANMELVREVWPPIVAEAKAAGIRIGIEHCPMLYWRPDCHIATFSPTCLAIWPPKSGNLVLEKWQSGLRFWHSGECSSICRATLRADEIVRVDRAPATRRTPTRSSCCRCYLAPLLGQQRGTEVPFRMC